VLVEKYMVAVVGVEESVVLKRRQSSWALLIQRERSEACLLIVVYGK
jgi:hypothetical protein